MAVTIDQFGKALVASGLLTAEEVKALWSAIPAAERPKDGDAFAQMLIKQERLSEFQAKELLSGSGTPLVLNQYVLLSKIGAGGMGQVFKAQHRKMKRLAAIKLLPAALTKDEAAVKRFQREVEAAAKLSHPNIVQTHDADECRGIHYMVMECVDGQDLSALVKQRGPLPVHDAVDYILQAARGLAFAHAEGVVHRDIKPANLLLDKKGVVKILDMGLARIDDGNAADHQLTNTGTVMGTVDYMPPEQANDTRKADARSDVYSLGCSLYRILTGESVFGGETVVQKIMAHMGDPIPSLQTKRPDCPAEIDRIFQKMLAKRPDDRYQQAAHVVAELEAWRNPGATTSFSSPSATTNDPALSQFFGTMQKGSSSASPSGSQTMPVDDLTEALGNRPLKSLSGPEATLSSSRAEIGTDPKSQVVLPLTGAKPSPTSTKPKAGGKGGKKPPVKLIVAGAAGFLFLLLGVILLIKNDKGETVAEVKVAYGNNVEVKPPAGGSVQIKPDGATPMSPVQTPVADTPGSKVVTLPGPRWPFDPPDGREYVWSEPENLGSSVNTSKRELCPSLTSDELTMFFCRGTALFFARRADRNSAFSQAESFADSEFAPPEWREIVSASITGDGLTIYFHPVGPQPKRIWTTRRASTDARFEKPTMLPAPVNTSSNSERPVVSADGRTLCVSSSRPSRLQGSDIFMFRRNSPSEPFGGELNLGPAVNTKGMIAPDWISDDGLVLVNTVMTTPPFQQVWHRRASTSEPFSPGIPFGPVFNEETLPSCTWVSTDGRRIYFHSRSFPGGQGDLDLWTSRRVPKSGSPPAATTIPAEALTFGGHRYLLVEIEKTSDKITWNDAKARAEAMGGRLAVITSQAEFDGVRDNVLNKKWTSSQSVRVFLGGFIPQGTDKPQWITGEPFDFASWADGKVKAAKSDRDNFLMWTFDGWRITTTELVAFLVEWDTLGPAIGASQGNAPPLAKAPFDAAQAKAHQQAWAKHLGTQVETTNSVGQKMVLIPPGEFLMGSSDEQIAAALKVVEEIKIDQGARDRIQKNERPQHKVVITKPFLMSATEVTVGQFKKFSATGYQTEAEKLEAAAKAAPPPVEAGQPPPKPIQTYLNPGYVVSDDLPAAFITWNDAVAYCKWLSEQEKRTYRLPTEAEWEYASRAGTTTQYSFGDDYNELPKYGWHNKNAGGKSHPVGTLLSNPFGLFDMHGNLQEWCGDFFDEKWYEKTSPKDPIGPSVGSSRVIRGGPWNANASNCRSAYRYHNTPSYPTLNQGFRCVSELSVPAAAASVAPQPTVPVAASGKLFMHDPAFPQWMKDVQAMPAEQQIEAVSKKLVELNPGFDGKVTGVEGKETPKIENGFVTEIGFATDNVTDVSPVRALAGLKFVNCSAGRWSKLSDLSPFTGMTLESLFFSGASVSDLSPLTGMPLIALRCNNTKVSDLSPLKGTRLSELEFGSTEVFDVSPLRDLPLTGLWCGNSKISDLSPLQACKSLNYLNAAKTKVTSAQVAALQKALPKCKIEWNDPAKATTTQPAASGTK